MLAGRLVQIMDIIKRNGKATVAELADECHVTSKTIRHDLDVLEEMDMVARVHGGALLVSSYQDIYPAVSRNEKHQTEKQSIAAEALAFIEDGDIVFLDSGTTTLELARVIDKNIIVITNDMAVASECVKHKNVTLYCTGGMLQRSDITNLYVGPDAISFIKHYRTQKCFMGCSAVNFDRGLMVFSSIEAELKRTIVQASDQLICLADNSKIGRTAFASYASISEVDYCITDANTPDEYVSQLRDRNVKVIVSGK